MLLLRQLEFAFRNTDTLSVASEFGGRMPAAPIAETTMSQLLRSVDSALEEKARTLLRTNGADRIATEIRVEWNSRLKTCAGRVHYRQRLISLNPQLIHHPVELDPRNFAPAGIGFCRMASSGGGLATIWKSATRSAVIIFRSR